MVAFGKYLQRKQIEEWSGYAFAYDISVLAISFDHLIFFS